MDPINSLLKLLENQRQQSSNKVNKGIAKSHTKPLTSNTQSLQGSVVSLDQVKLSVKEQLKKLDKKDPDFRAKAFRIFVHNILSWKLGDQILNDTAFNEVAYDVERLMLNDETLRRQFEDMLKELV